MDVGLTHSLNDCKSCSLAYEFRISSQNVRNPGLYLGHTDFSQPNTRNYTTPNAATGFPNDEYWQDGQHLNTSNGIYDSMQLLSLKREGWEYSRLLNFYHNNYKLCILNSNIVPFFIKNLNKTPFQSFSNTIIERKEKRLWSMKNFGSRIIIKEAKWILVNHVAIMNQAMPLLTDRGIKLFYLNSLKIIH
jgi:hypothetical protein